MVYDDGNNNFSTSSLLNNLNETASGGYKALFDTNTLNLIGTTKFKIKIRDVQETLESSIFVMSRGEFVTIIAHDFKIATTSNGIAVAKWTRTEVEDTANKAYNFNDCGVIGTPYVYSGNNYVCPCFTLPASTKVDSNGLIIT